MIKPIPMMICPYCVITADLDPSYALLVSQAPLPERAYVVPVNDFTHHCFVHHIRLANPTSDERLAWLVKEKLREHALSNVRPHGRCADSERCVEHDNDQSVRSCKRRPRTRVVRTE